MGYAPARQRAQLGLYLSLYLVGTLARSVAKLLFRSKQYEKLAGDLLGWTRQEVDLKCASAR